MQCQFGLAAGRSRIPLPPGLIPASSHSWFAGRNQRALWRFLIPCPRWSQLVSAGALLSFVTGCAHDSSSQALSLAAGRVGPGMHTTPRDLPFLPLLVELSVLCGLDCTCSERPGGGLGEKNRSGDFYSSSPKNSGKGGLPGWRGKQAGCRAGGRPRRCQQLLHLSHH